MAIFPSHSTSVLTNAFVDRPHDALLVSDKYNPASSCLKAFETVDRHIDSAQIERMEAVFKDVSDNRLVRRGIYLSVRDLLQNLNCA